MKSINSTTSHSPGPSGVCPLLVKRTSGIIAGHLMLLYRKILDDKTVPMINLTSLISPFLKPNKSPNAPGSYRPVSLTEVFIRILEKTIKEKLTDFLEAKGVFGKAQHGFRRHFSTSSNLLLQCERTLKALEEGKSVDSVYIDLSKGL